MGYRLNSNALALKEKIEMVSTAVCKGLVQLLPGGQTIALMADCQTVGGYPRIAKIIEVDMIICSQLKPGDEINFEMVSIEEAEQLYLAQEKQLLQVQEKIQQLFS
jgi:antagonist of KipI